MIETAVQQSLFDVTTPAAKWDLDASRRALDELFSQAGQYKSTASYLELMNFVARFRFYSPFNAMLVHTQMPGATYVAPAHRWLREYSRRIQPGARPLVILQPMGPVMFVFDVAETEPEADAPDLPQQVTNPFEVRHGRIGLELRQTAENAKRDGIEVVERPAGSQRAGSIRIRSSGRSLRFQTRTRPTAKFVRVPVRYYLELNANHSSESRYATLVHELAHLYCGHLGTPNEKWWPDRRGLEHTVREFEAESVCHLICGRLGITNPSAEYLSGYQKEHDDVPPISLDCVMKTAGLIEQMGEKRLKIRKEGGQ